MANATRGRIFCEAAEKGLLMFPEDFGGHACFKAEKSGGSFSIADWAPIDATQPVHAARQRRAACHPSAAAQGCLEQGRRGV